MEKKLMAVTAVAAAAMLALSGCSQGGQASGGSGSGDKSPIVVGSVNTDSGPATFPEASQAAKAVFDQFNAQGGLDGQKIKYVAQDDKGDPATATALARQIVGQDEAVAMVGSASLIECELNAKYYQQQGILSIPGIGVDRGCFDSPNISPANVGPFNDTTLTLLYGTQVLHADHICALLEIAGNTKPAYQAAIAKWEKVTGQKLFYADYTVPYGASDYTAYLVKAKQAGCKTIMNNPVEPDSIAMLKNAQAMGWNDVTWLLLTSVYSTNYANSVTDTGKGVYVPAEFYPFTEVNSQTKAWRDLMDKNNIKLTAFSQGGYLAATHFISVLKQMKKDGKSITRQNVTDALHNLKPIEDPMIGTPYTFGTAKVHDTNICGWPIQLMTGTNKWALAAKGGDKWLCIPKD